MITVVLTIIVLGIIIAAMSVGVILANKPIKGSCGGMAAVGIDSKCDICGGNPKKCDEEQQRASEENSDKNSLAYNAADSDR